MGHAGEWTESAMAGGVERVSWGYITDYEADMGTLVIFERGKVVEIKNTPWVGQGKYK